MKRKCFVIETNGIRGIYLSFAAGEADKYYFRNAF